MTGEYARLDVDPELEKLRRLTEIGRALTYTTSLGQVARIAVERGAGLLGAPSAALLLRGTDDLLHVRAAHGIEERRLALASAPMTDESIGELQALLGVSDDGFMAVPLVVEGAVTGLLAVGLNRPSTAADEWLLSALADQAAVALAHARLGGEVTVDLENRLRLSEGSTTAKERALATLAHDIRSPLGAIDGYCSNLVDGLYGPVTDAQRAALERVRMSGHHLLSLLDNVMDMVRLDAGVFDVPLEPVECEAVAREAVDMLAHAAEAKRQVLEVADVTHVVVTANHARMRQVLVNLLGNAVKFTPEGGTISVTVTRKVIDGATWGEIRVRDTGPGIAPPEQASIFEPYYRSRGTAVLPGIGLGLAISRSLVTQMGGELTVESAVGAGSTFAMRFPAREG